MNKKFFSSLSIIAVAFALVFGFGAINVVKAVPGGNDNYNAAPEGVNLFGVDEADNSIRAIDRDADVRAFEFTPDSYGLSGSYVDSMER